MTIDASSERWVPDDSTFGARLALVRQRMAWNVKEAALACNLPQGSWREWEFSGRRPRDLQEVCEKIAERTGCDEIWLMTGRIHRPGPGDGGGLPVPAADGAPGGLPAQPSDYWRTPRRSADIYELPVAG